MPPDHRRLCPRHFQLGAVALALLGLLVRLMPWRHIFGPEGRVALPGVDPYYHLWRAEQLAAHFPQVPHFDPWLSFPGGAPIPWPPGFDLLLSLPGLLGRADWIPTWAALLPALLGALAVYLCALLGRRWFGAAAGLLAAGLLALMHGALSFSFLGRADHHALVAPVVLGMMLLTTRGLEADSPRARLGAGLGLGSLVFLSISSWIVTPPLYFLPPAAAVFIALIQAIPGARQKALALLIPSVLGALAAVLATADLSGQAWALFQNSWFVFLPYAAIMLLALPALRWPRLSLALAFALGLGILLVAWLQPFDNLLSKALEVGLGRHNSFALISESAPLYRHQGRFSLRWATQLYTYGVLLWPLLALGLLLWTRKRRWPLGPVLACFYAFWACALLTLQQRFGEYAAPALALMLGWAMVHGWRGMGRLRGQIPDSRRRLLSGALLLAVLAALSPIPRSLWTLASEDPVAYQRSLLAFAPRLRRALPPVNPDAQGHPDWGLLCHWRDAHPIRWAAELPVSTSAFTTPVGLAGNARAFRIFLQQDEEAAYRDLTRLRLDYVLVSPALEIMQRMATAAHVPQRFTRSGFERIPDGWLRTVHPMAAYARSLQARLWLTDGRRVKLDQTWLQGLGHFRLLDESRTTTPRFDHDIALFKLYRVLPGARIAGQADAGQLVGLRLNLVCPWGRRFTYQRLTRTDEQGAFSLRLPYADAGKPSDTGCRGQGPVRVKIGERVVELTVSEEQVLGGATITLPLISETK